jgi:hypothetical protein
MELPPIPLEHANLFDAEITAVESSLGSPQPNLPSRMQRLVTPLRRLVLRCIRVYWVQQLAVDRAILAAMRTLRRESRSELTSHATMIQQQSAETARMREELTELAANVRALHERVGEIVPQVRAKTRADGG